MKKIILTLIFSALIQLVFSQENKTDSVKAITTKTTKDKRVDKLKESYAKHYALKGFRVQIYSGNKKQPANQARATFLRVHPKTKAHLNYQQPYYKVRVGDFKTKLEALKYKNELIKQFPNCFIVKDEIDIEELTE